MSDTLKPDLTDDEQYCDTEGPVCPYCGRQFTADEAHYYDEEKYQADECDECGKTFGVEVVHTTSWTTRKEESR